jgi:adenylate cyclase
MLVWPSWRLGAILLAGVAAIAAIGWAGFSMRRLYVPIVPPALAWSGSLVATTIDRYRRERENNAAWAQLAQRFFSGKIARSLWAQRRELFDHGRLRSKLLDATVLFTDLRGFSAISETMQPGALMDWLNEYFQAINGLVEQHGGTINKFNADQLVALFGPPFERTAAEARADAAAAVHCAIAMRAKFAELNTRWASHKLPMAQMRVGIHSGGLVAGTLGSLDRLEYTVIGDVVNTASRLESFDKDMMGPEVAPAGCRILIGGATRELLGEQFDARFLGELVLTGKRQKIAVYAVVGYRANGEPPAPEPPPPRESAGAAAAAVVATSSRSST